MGSLHKRTLGAAHVVALSRAASFELTNRVGKEFSVFDAGVRTYRPGFDTERDDRFRHPLCIRSRIGSWAGGPDGLEAFLVSQALARSVAVADPSYRLTSFAAATQAAAEHQLSAQRAAGATDRELLALADDEISKLRQNLKDEEDLLTFAEMERDEAKREAEEAQSLAFRLRQRIDSLLKTLEVSRETPAAVAIPADLESFASWCDEQMAGQVEVLKRAQKGARNSVFHDHRLLYRALLLLRDYYVPMKREGGLERKRAFDEAAKGLGLEEEPSFAGTQWAMEGDTYKVMFGGKNRILDRHLKRGESREPRYCFRLYFFWDDETEQVIVGWLPSHLDTRAT